MAWSNFKTDNPVDEIKADCERWSGFPESPTHGPDDWLDLKVCAGSAETGYYQLLLNGNELWYGTLSEINAVVKSMIRRVEHADDYSY